MKKISKLVLSSVLFLSFSCYSHKVAESPEWFYETEEALNDGSIIVKGSGSASEKFKGKDNQEFMAEESAISNVRTNFIEMILGSSTDSVGKTIDREAVSQYTQTDLSGYLKGIIILKRYYKDGKYYLKAKINKADVDKILQKINQKFDLNIKYNPSDFRNKK